MPDTLPDLQPAPAVSSDDPFFDQVIASVRRHEAPVRRAEQITGEPYRYSLSNTAGFTGLPVRRLRRLCLDGEIQAVKLSGWWLVHRDEFMRLLAPAASLSWRSSRSTTRPFNRWQYSEEMSRQLRWPPTLRPSRACRQPYAASGVA